MIGKYFYFRTEEDADDDSAITGHSAMFPVNKLRGVIPTNTGSAGTSADEVTLYFEPVATEESNGGGDYIIMDSVLLNVTVGQAKNVCKALAEAANGHPHSDGVITVADDQTIIIGGAAGSATAEVLHSGITSCGAITLAPAIT
jgi:hypothetical protein